MQANAQTEIDATTKQTEATTEPTIKPNGGITKFKTTCAFLRNGTCSRTLMTVLNRSFGHPQRREERATDHLAGGLMRGYQCGMLWGATLAAGAEAHRRLGAGPRAEAAAMRAAQELVGAFRAGNGCINCHEITETDPRDGWQTFVYFFLKGGTIGCVRRANAYAPKARGAIEAALSAAEAEAEAQAQGGAEPRACQPASCAALLARRMGATEQQATMAAGLAGGIGQSGGACGALGAAIWLLSLRARAAGQKTKALSAQIDALVERFIESADHELECEEIVGRTFEGDDDHAAYLRGGGCAELIEALAAAAGTLAEAEAEVAATEPEPAAAPEPEGEYAGGAAAAG